LPPLKAPAGRRFERVCPGLPAAGSARMSATRCSSVSPGCVGVASCPRQRALGWPDNGSGSATHHQKACVPWSRPTRIPTTPAAGGTHPPSCMTTIVTRWPNACWSGWSGWSCCSCPGSIWVSTYLVWGSVSPASRSAPSPVNWCPGSRPDSTLGTALLSRYSPPRVRPSGSHLHYARGQRGHGVSLSITTTGLSGAPVLNVHLG
jgi:hypothetical protein